MSPSPSKSADQAAELAEQRRVVGSATGIRSQAHESDEDEELLLARCKEAGYHQCRRPVAPGVGLCKGQAPALAATKRPGVTRCGTLFDALGATDGRLLA